MKLVVCTVMVLWGLTVVANETTNEVVDTTTPTSSPRAKRPWGSVQRLPTTNTLHSKHNATAASYHNYPYSKFALPECATQQVCNAVYTRLNRIHSLCACPDKYVDPCSISFKSNDEHTIELITDNSGKALTLVKTCEPINTVRECRGPQDWSILALQNIRTGKSHYLVTCRCLNGGILEGPIAHENPPYAKIPGIRVYGMVCNQKIKKRQHRLLTRTPREIAKRQALRRPRRPRRSGGKHWPPVPKISLLRLVQEVLLR